MYMYIYMYMYMYLFSFVLYTCISALCLFLSLFKGALRLDLIEQGAVAGLVSCLSHVDTRVQQLSLEAIALLSVESGAREQVMRRLL